GDKTLEIRLSPQAAARVPHPADTKAIPEELARLIAVPVEWTTPRWVAEDAPAPTGADGWKGRRVLILTDQPSLWLSGAARDALAGVDYRVACPADRGVEGAIAISLANDADAQKTVRQLDAWEYDALVAVKDLEGCDAIDSVTAPAAMDG